MEFDKVYLDKEIFYIDNFITEEENKILLDYALDENNWNTTYHIHMTSAEQGTKTHAIFMEINSRLAMLLNDENNLVNGSTAIQRFTDKTAEDDMEWALCPHSDNHSYGDGSSKFVNSGYIIYLNDNYEGGEIIYINKDILLKPVPRRIVCHSGSEEYLHGVKAVKNGIRYMITGFVYDREYRENFNKSLP